MNLVKKNEIMNLPSKLYHGTGARNLKGILANGLVPRSVNNKRTNWIENPSQSDRVYLTSAYAPYFALASCTRKGEKAVVLEIDTGKLVGTFVADEDAIEQTFRIPKDVFNREVMLTKTQEAARNAINLAETGKFTAIDSLQKLGTCAFIGTIPPEAISRYVIMDAVVALMNWDATITLLNFTYCGPRYKEMLSGLFDMSTDIHRRMVTKMVNLRA